MALKSKSMDDVRPNIPVIKETMVRVNLSVPASAQMAWKIEAAQQRRDVSGLVAEVMNNYLNAQKNKVT